VLVGRSKRIGGISSPREGPKNDVARPRENLALGSGKGQGLSRGKNESFHRAGERGGGGRFRGWFPRFAGRSDFGGGTRLDNGMALTHAAQRGAPDFPVPAGQHSAREMGGSAPEKPQAPGGAGIFKPRDGAEAGGGAGVPIGSMGRSRPRGLGTKSHCLESWGWRRKGLGPLRAGGKDGRGRRDLEDRHPAQAPRFRRKEFAEPGPRYRDPWESLTDGHALPKKRSSPRRDSRVELRGHCPAAQWRPGLPAEGVKIRRQIPSAEGGASRVHGRGGAGQGRRAQTGGPVCPIGGLGPSVDGLSGMTPVGAGQKGPTFPIGPRPKIPALNLVGDGRRPAPPGNGIRLGTSALRQETNPGGSGKKKARRLDEAGVGYKGAKGRRPAAPGPRAGPSDDCASAERPAGRNRCGHHFTMGQGGRGAKRGPQEYGGGGPREAAGRDRSRGRVNQNLRQQVGGGDTGIGVFPWDDTTRPLRTGWPRALAGRQRRCQVVSPHVPD